MVRRDTLAEGRRIPLPQISVVTITFFVDVSSLLISWCMSGLLRGKMMLVIIGINESLLRLTGERRHVKLLEVPEPRGSQAVPSTMA